MPRMLVCMFFKDVEDEKREFFRLVRGTERLVAQGFPKSTRFQLESDALCVFASGNAYPPPLIIACVHGMIAGMSHFDLVNWPPPDRDTEVPANIHQFRAIVFKKGKIVDRAKAAKAREKASEVKRGLKRRGSFHDSD